jgi:polyvinyl alcohol dehydrogenase (cytochrome)
VIAAGDLLLAGGSGFSVELQRLPFQGFLAAFQRATGGGLWRSYTVPATARGVGIWSAPAVDLDATRAYVTTGNNYGPPATDTANAFIAFDLQGTMLWKNQRLAGDTGATFQSEGNPPVVSDLDFGANPVLYEAVVGGVMTELVSAGAKSGTAHALRRSDGMEVWSRALGSGDGVGTRGIFSNSTWTGKSMLFAINEGDGATLHALDGATGDIVWSLALPGGKVWGRTAVANGVGFVGTGQSLVVFDADTGAFIKSFATVGTVAGTITVANGRVAFGEGLAWSDGRYGDTLTVLAVP